MNKILGFFKKLGTVYILLLWGLILYLLICMLLHFSHVPDFLALLLPLVFIYFFIKKSRIIATVTGIGVGIISVFFCYGIAGTVGMMKDYYNRNSEAVLSLLIIIGVFWYLIRYWGKKR